MREPYREVGRTLHATSLLFSVGRRAMREPLPIWQFRVGVVSFHFSVAQFDDGIGVLDGAQAVGDEDDGDFPVESFDGGHDFFFGAVVEGAGGLVEYDDGGVFIQGSGDADALPLAAAEADTAFAYGRVVFFREFFDERFDLGQAGGVLHPCEVNFGEGDSEGDVFQEGAIAQEDVLRHMGDGGLPLAQAFPFEGHVVHQDTALSGAEQAQDQVGGSTFPAACGADERGGGIGRDVQVQVFEYPVQSFRVAEADSFQAHFAGHPLRGYLFDLHRRAIRQAEGGEDALDRAARALEAGYGAKGVLQGRQQALGPHRQSAQHRYGAAKVPLAPYAQHEESQGYEGEAFDQVDRRHIDDFVGGQALVQLAHYPHEGLVEVGVQMVEQHIANTSNPFLDDFDPRRARLHDTQAVVLQAPVAHPIDYPVCRAKDDDSQ